MGVSPEISLSVNKTAAGRSARWPEPMILAVMAIGVAVFYAASAWHNGFVFDDHIVIETLPAQLTAHDLAELFGRPHYLNFLYYRPITRASLAIQRAAWGLSPRSFHLFNAIEAGLVCAAVYLLLRSRQFAIHPLAAKLAALWLALHPATSECVFPAASGRESLMPMLFIPLAVWAYLRGGWKWYAGAMILFVLALLSKEQAAVLPGLFLLADLIWPGKSASWRQRLMRWIPILLIYCGYFVLRHLIFGGRSIHIDVWNHPLEPLQSLLYGVQTAIAPFVELRYEPPMKVWFSWPLSFVSALMLVILIIGVLKSAKPVVLAAIFWLAWFVLLQLPTAHLVAEQEALFSERYVALAALAFPAIVAGIASQFYRPAAIKISVAAAMVWIAILGAISFARGGFYANDLAFDGQWELTNPRSAVAHSGMGVAFEKRGDIARAIGEYNAALACNPDDWTANDNLGVILLNRGQYWPAERHFRIVVAAKIHDPQIMVNYGITLEMISMQEKNVPFRDAARKWFEHAIEADLNYANAHFELGAWHVRFGDAAIARSELQKALSLDPNLRQARNLLGELTRAKRRPDGGYIAP